MENKKAAIAGSLNTETETGTHYNMPSPQQAAILQHLKEHDGITTYEAYTHLGITQLQARIAELTDKGYVFVDKWEEHTNRYGSKKPFKRYWLVSTPAQAAQKLNASGVAAW